MSSVSSGRVSVKLCFKPSVTTINNPEDNIGIFAGASSLVIQSANRLLVGSHPSDSQEIDKNSLVEYLT